MTTFQKPPELIGDVARRKNRSVAYVDKLERRGVLRAFRTASGVRLFDPDQVDRDFPPARRLRDTANSGAAA